MANQKSIFDLKVVAALARDADNLFSKTKALDPVINFYGLTLDEAKAFIEIQLQTLTDDNFSSSVFFDNCYFDIYGIIIDDIAWYIKFSICNDSGESDDYLYAISFHPVVKPLKTRMETLQPTTKACGEEYEH